MWKQDTLMLQLPPSVDLVAKTLERVVVQHMSFCGPRIIGDGSDAHAGVLQSFSWLLWCSTQ
jgi:hypothetical protein